MAHIWMCRISNLRLVLPSRSMKTLSSGATVSALRAFYLSVHPDFFAQHPQIQKINESSLKRLNSYLEAVQCSKQIRNLQPTKVSFYFRRQQSMDKSITNDDFKLVHFTLRSHDLLTNIEHILSSCGLSASHLDEISRKSSVELPLEQRYRKTTINPQWGATFHTQDKKPDDAGDAKNLGLRRWLQKNISEIRNLQESSRLIINNNEALKNDIAMSFGLRKISWCSSWQYKSEQGILRNFAKFCSQHKEQMQSLQGKKLVFTDKTMISADESICLSVEDVPQQWLQFLIKYQSVDSKLFDKANHLDKIICDRCGNIKVVRPEVRMSRVRTHSLVSIHEYITMLSKITSKILSMKQTEELTLTPWSMRNHEIMFVTSHNHDGDKITLTSSGRFHADMNCDPRHLQGYLIQKKPLSEERLYSSASEKSRSHQLTSLCKDKLEIPSMCKDFDVEHHQSSKFCEKLLQNSAHFSILLKGIDIRITLNYYSFFDQGNLCVPWDF